jgi:hypothetical protein
MTAQEWRARGRAQGEEQAVDLALPSGMVIRARRPGPMQYAAWDRLPLLLLEVGERGKGGPTDAQALEITGLLRELLAYCCLEPRVSDHPAEDEIAPKEIPEPDWVFVVRWAMRLEEAAKLRPFRVERKDGGDHLDGERVLMQTIGADGYRGSGDGFGL